MLIASCGLYSTVPNSRSSQLGSPHIGIEQPQGSNASMTIEEIRHQNLLALIAEAGSSAALAERCTISAVYVSQLKTGTKTKSGKVRGVGRSLARQLEAGMGKPSGWMDVAHYSAGAIAAPQARDEPTHVRMVPIISNVAAGEFTPAHDPFPEGHGDGAIDPRSLPVPVGPRAFALRVKGDSMRESFNDGDLVVIDPDVEPRPREPVVARRDEDDEATFKMYVPRGHDDAGYPIIELHPLNPHFQTLVISADHPGRIVGPMVARVSGRWRA